MLLTLIRRFCYITIISSEVLLKNVSILGLAIFHPLHCLLDFAHRKDLYPWLNVLLGSELLEEKTSSGQKPSMHLGGTHQHFCCFLLRPNARSSQTTAIDDEIDWPNLGQQRVGNANVDESTVDEQEPERM
jgi:hypothetical protein